MSILDNDLTVIEIVSKQLVNQTRQTFKSMTQAFNDGSKNFWNNPRGVTPTEIASALGTDAREVFELHYKLGQFISDIQPEAIQEGLSVIGNFTMNEDGTVTIITSENPE